MFTYKALFEACENLNINIPNKRKLSPNIDLIKVKPVDLESIPGINLKIVKEILLIGKLVNNLISKGNSIINFPEDFKTQKAIKMMLPILETSQRFWLEKELGEDEANKIVFLYGIPFNDKDITVKFSKKEHENMVRRISNLNQTLRKNRNI